MSEQPKLRPCPACDSINVQENENPQDVFVFCRDCLMTGPRYDTHGASWNKLPRRDDVKPDDDERLLVEFAKAAVPMALEHPAPEGMNEHDLLCEAAGIAFDMADAMLAELKRRREVKAL